MFGFPVTLEHMLVIAIVIWGIIGALISYYRTYLRYYTFAVMPIFVFLSCLRRNRRKKEERVRLDAEYSKHETVCHIL